MCLPPLDLQVKYRIETWTHAAVKDQPANSEIHTDFEETYPLCLLEILSKIIQFHQNQLINNTFVWGFFFTSYEWFRVRACAAGSIVGEGVFAVRSGMISCYIRFFTS